MNRVGKIAVIFAGGKSKRMGRDKALLPFKDYPTLAEYQFKKMSDMFDTVYISSKSNKFDFDAPIIMDTHRDSSPMVGLVSIFERLDGVDEVFVLGVDIPFMNRDTIEEIYNRAMVSKDVIVAKSPNGLEPLCGIYRREIFSVAKELLEMGEHRLQTLLNSVDTQNISFQNGDIFMNLNHMFEYEMALLR